MKTLLHLLFPKSLDRPQYVVRILCCTALVVGLYLVRGLVDPIANATMLIVWNYAAFFVILPRLRDCGMSFIYALLALVPLIYVFLFIVLMFRPPKYELRKAAYDTTPTT